VALLCGVPLLFLAFLQRLHFLPVPLLHLRPLGSLSCLLLVFVFRLQRHSLVRMTGIDLR
jgi:hypothetical protein